jgi:hypothetical protein
MPASAIASAVWLVWMAVLLGCYYTVPGDRFALLDGWPSAFPFWFDALGRTVRAAGASALVLLAGWGASAVIATILERHVEHRVDRSLFRLALGLAMLSYALFALAALGLFSPPGATVVVAIAAARGVFDLRRIRPLPRAPRLDRIERLWIGCAAVAMTFALVGALAPETEYDALWYHLWLPRVWLDAGRPADIIHEYVSLYPLTWDLLYGAAMVVGGPVGAKLLHFLCLPLLALTTWRLTRLIFPAASAPLAVAILTTAPVVIWEATTAYIDLALTWYLALGVYALARFELLERRAAWLVLGAVMFGIAAAIKHLALVVLALACVWILVGEIRRRKAYLSAARTALVFGAMAIAIPSPWYVRAYAASGNPVFPDLYPVFGAEPETRWSDGTELALREFKDRFGPARTPANLLRLPWDMTVHGARFGGTIGPIFLLLVPLSLFAGRRARLLVLVCGAYLAVWASPVSSFQMRFVIPMLPVLAAALAGGARVIPWSGAIVVPLLLLNLPPFIEWHEADRRGSQGWLTHVVRRLPLRVVVGSESTDRYLARSVPSYAAWRYIDSKLPDDVRVLTFSGGDHLYGARDRLWANAWAAYPLTWGLPAGREELARSRLAARGFSHVLFDRRQLERGEIRHLAIGSDRMRACCLEKVYEDGRFVLFAVR